MVTPYTDDENHTAVFLEPDRGQLRWQLVRGGNVERGSSLGRLRADFAAGAHHQLVVQPAAGEARVSLDGRSMGSLPAPQGPCRRLGDEPDAGDRVGGWPSPPWGGGYRWSIRPTAPISSRTCSSESVGPPPWPTRQ